MRLTVNGQPCDVDDGSTVARLLEKHGLADRHVAVEVNRKVIARARHAEYRLEPGDQVEIVTLVGGG